jgi:hypothetical protein
LNGTRSSSNTGIQTINKRKKAKSSENLKSKTRNSKKTKNNDTFVSMVSKDLLVVDKRPLEIQQQ